MNDHQRELLTMLAEEANEVAIACTKALRHGLLSYHPDRPDQSNLDDLRRELTDLHAVVTMLEGTGLAISGHRVDAAVVETLEQKRQWMHTQNSACTVDLVAQNSDLAERNAKLKAEVASGREQIKKMEAERARWWDELNTRQARCNTLDQARVRAEDELRDARARMEKTIAEQEAELIEARDDLNAAQERCKTPAATARKVQAERNEAQHELRQLKNDVAQEGPTEAEFIALRDELTSVKKSRDELLAMLQQMRAITMKTLSGA